MSGADLDAVAVNSQTARMLNNGQSLHCGETLHCARGRQKPKKQLVEKFEALCVGDPMNPEIYLGPLATPSILKDLDRRVKESVMSGAKVLTTGDKSSVGSSRNFIRLRFCTDIPPSSRSRRILVRWR